MNEHLTQKDMEQYASITAMTPENLAFVSRWNTHMFQCEECKDKLNAYCAQMEQDLTWNYDDRAPSGMERG